MRSLRAILVALLTVVAALVMASPVLAEWPTTCVDLNDIVEAHLGNDENVGIYQRVFFDQAEQGCQNDHRDDVRGVFAWAFAGAAEAAALEAPDLAWPSDCVELNDIVEAHLGNVGNVGIYQGTFGAEAETACRNEHREDVRGVFAWAFEPATTSASGPPLSYDELVTKSQAAVRYISTAGDGCGSAFVVTADGYVVTNSHVLIGAEQAVVGTSDGRQEFASVVADDPERDLALLKLPGRGPHPYLAFGRSADLEVGEPLVILGYPLCLETFSSATGTLTARQPGWLQTNARANHGSSGGPALDVRGGVIGVATKRLIEDAGREAENDNLLIDGDSVRQLLDSWIASHRAQAGAQPPAPPVAAAWAAVDTGTKHTCGVRSDGIATCWGSNTDWQEKYSGQALAPAGAFRSVSAGGYHTCGVWTDGTLACWGSNDNGQAAPPPGAFQSVSAGDHYTCGVRTDGSLACWGWNGHGQAAPPPGAFRSMSAGQHHACGVRTDGKAVCWGWNEYGQAVPPAGTFESVSAGLFHTCGVRTNNTVACWGGNEDGQARPPPGPFAAVSAGGSSTCGVRPDGSLSCWGANREGQAAPPPGNFDSVSVGWPHSCGVRTNGSVVCWGSNTYGRAAPPA